MSLVADVTPFGSAPRVARIHCRRAYEARLRTSWSGWAWRSLGGSTATRALASGISSARSRGRVHARRRPVLPGEPRSSSATSRPATAGRRHRRVEWRGQQRTAGHRSSAQGQQQPRRHAARTADADADAVTSFRDGARASGGLALSWLAGAGSSAPGPSTSRQHARHHCSASGRHSGAGTSPGRSSTSSGRRRRRGPVPVQATARSARRWRTSAQPYLPHRSVVRHGTMRSGSCAPRARGCDGQGRGRRAVAVSAAGWPAAPPGSRRGPAARPSSAGARLAGRRRLAEPSAGRASGRMRGVVVRGAGRWSQRRVGEVTASIVHQRR
jgi:hypothetical protein